MKKIVFCLLILLLLPLSMYAGDKQAGVVSMAVGHPRIIRAGAKVASILIYGDKVFQGDKIVTGITGTVKLFMDDGSILTISNNSEFKINKFFVSEGSRKSIFSLLKGKVKSVVKRFTSKGSGFFVKTPTAVAGVRGTTFVIEVSGGKTDIYLVSGELKVWGNGNKKDFLILKSGMSSTVVKGKVPSSPKSYRKALLPVISDSSDEYLQELSDDIVAGMENGNNPRPGASQGGGQGEGYDGKDKLGIIPSDVGQFGGNGKGDDKANIKIRVGF